MIVKQPNRIKHRYRQSLTAPPEDVFPLLCPVLELDWVRGWDPELVLSNSGVAEQDCIFILERETENEIWVITKYDPEYYQLEMLKVTPDHSVGKIEIALFPDEGNRTFAEIVYSYTSLGPQGDEFLVTFTEEWYHKFMETWEEELNHYLSTGEKLP
ncbi:hypothetical protein ACFL9T_06535 [Thermodesulfobacteriota bacterium]